MAEKTGSSKEYLVKARWRATALILRIAAKNEEQAWRKARAAVLRMQGALSCEDITILREL